jgi:hypothetical protein
MPLELLSTELKQIIIGFLDILGLKSLRNTNKTLRDLVDSSLAQSNIILPARAKLLRLYLELHLYPSFIASRKHIVPHLTPFSRTQYLEDLQRQILNHNPKARVPEEFAIWILEWPDNAVISWAWPTLDEHFDMATGRRGERFEALFTFSLEPVNASTEPAKGEEVHWWRMYGSNMLCFTGDNGPDNRLCWSQEDDEQPGSSKPELLGLLVQYHGCTVYTVLFFDCDSPRDGMVLDACDICEMAEIEIWQEGPWLVRGWTDWLKGELMRVDDQYNCPY